MLSFRLPTLTLSALFICQHVSAQVMERDLGDFDLKLATTPTRSMAQGLVTPGSDSGSFHGGMDLTHESGFYFGQWSPNMGFAEDTNLEVDSYMGFKKPFDNTLGYELGVIRYSYPDTSQIDSHEFYAGLRVRNSRVGAAFSDDVGTRNSTLFIDLGGIEQLGLGVRMQYANHQFDTPQTGGDGALISGFNDWSLNLSRPWLGIDMNLIYSDSSLNGSDCSVYSGHNSRCEGTFTLKAVRSFF
ncbi:TorF family putative porin [Pseudomonas sp. NPDC089734]|uniref:TorF family putative porin n=1 Tax=Pseudomonas sp. NPDC089734 TaxID=3364469 RepID=UPI00380AEA09